MSSLSKVPTKAFDLLRFTAGPLAAHPLTSRGRPAMFAVAILQPAVTRRTRALFRLLRSWLDRAGRYLGRRAAIQWLRELDDRALLDIGLARSQVDAAVRGFMAARKPTEDQPNVQFQSYPVRARREP
jgi:uncharacterized protein YjiS (DUF1127 family)